MSLHGVSVKVLLLRCEESRISARSFFLRRRLGGSRPGPRVFRRLICFTRRKDGESDDEELDARVQEEAVVHASRARLLRVGERGDLLSRRG